MRYRVTEGASEPIFVRERLGTRLRSSDMEGQAPPPFHPLHAYICAGFPF